MPETISPLESGVSLKPSLEPTEDPDSPMFNLLAVDRYSESESQIGNSGSEDNCSLVNSHGTSGNTTTSNGNKESSGKNHSLTGQYNQNGSLSSSNEMSGQFANGHASNGSLEHASLKENTGKEAAKSKAANSAKKNSNKRSRNR